MSGNNNVVIFGTEPGTNNRYALQCDADGVLATNATVNIGANVDTKTILYSDLTPGSVKKIAIETLGVAPNAKDYLGTSDYNLRQSFDSSNSRIKVITEGVRGLSDTAPNDLTAVNVKPDTNKNALYVYDNALNTKITSDSSISSAIQVAVKNIVPISGSDYATPTPAYNPLYVDANGFITTNVLTTQHENIRLGFDYYKNMLTFLSNANSVFTVPSTATNPLIPALNNDGWLFKNTSSTNPTTGSLMWYNNGPYGATQFATQTDIAFNQLDVFYAIIQNYYPASQSKIEMNVYTKTTGSGDYSVNFRSKFNYILDLSPAQYLATGQSYMLYNGQVNRLKLNDPEVPRIKYDYNSAGSLGPLGNTEIVSHIELLFTDLLGGTQFLCNIIEGGLFSTNGHLVNYYFDNDIKTKTDTVISQLTFANNSLKTNISNDGTNSAAIAQNTISPIVNLNNTYGLVTDSVLYAKETATGDIKMLTQDSSGNLNVNLASGTISIGSVNIKDTAGNSLAAVSNTVPQLKTTLYNSSGTEIGTVANPVNTRITDGSNTATVTGMNGFFSGLKGVTTVSQVCGYSTSLAQNYPIGAQVVGPNYYLLTSDLNTAAISGDTDIIKSNTTNIDTKTVQQYNTTNDKISGFPTNGNIGLNMYVIPSKTRTFLFNAFTANTAANSLIGSINSSTTFSSFNFGLANSRFIYISRSATSSATLNLTLEYIDTAGNEQSLVIPAPLPTSITLALSGVISVNKWKTNAALTTTDTLNIAFGNGITFTYAGGNYYQNNNALFTCPNNAIAWVQNVSFYSQATDNLRLFKWDASGVRHTMFGWTNASNFNSNATGEYGFGGYITAGETIGWGGELTSTQKLVYSNVVCRYL